ncbi:hypothetical protein [Leisingera aquaemixtae]|uniref:Secreted protein n=1 Tax=Leisingera aquaemixtae TaxID=1396826 RepID=A0A0P1H6E4_9RHOB|nr:hypothetical protein [Leisingera aquaemixtae]CUH98357.1 hypothetical protein PHA8399_00471 [Leisingera aquaemixtae]
MYILPIVFGLLLVATPSAGQQTVFHTANFPDATMVQLSVTHYQVTSEEDFDFEVAIKLVQTDANGTVLYDDTRKHPVRVKCGEPAYVDTGLKRFMINTATSNGDWQHDLWAMLCTTATS